MGILRAVFQGNDQFFEQEETEGAEVLGSPFSLFLLFKNFYLSIEGANDRMLFCC
jgi:hypothetical protein